MAQDQKTSAIKAWGGFIEGRLHVEYEVINRRRGAAFALAIFASRKRARECYQDVRPIEIREVGNGKR